MIDSENASIIPSSIEVTSCSEPELPINYKDLENVNLDTRKVDFKYKKEVREAKEQEYIDKHKAQEQGER